MSNTANFVLAHKSFNISVLVSNLLGFLLLSGFGVILYLLDYSTSPYQCMALVVLSRALIEYFLWLKKFPRMMDKYSNSWRSRMCDRIISDVPTVKNVFDMFIDFIADLVLVFLAAKVMCQSTPILLIVYGSSQILSAVVHGYISLRVDVQRLRLLSMAITFLAVFMMLELSGVIAKSFYLNMFGVSEMDKLSNIVMIILIKNNFQYIVVQFKKYCFVEIIILVLMAKVTVSLSFSNARSHLSKTILSNS